MKLIGLSGYAQSGKDTVVSILAEVGFVRVSFADTLRACLYALNPILPLSGLRVQNAVDAMGWEEAKRIPEVRALLQRLGTDAGRNILGPNVWVDAALRRMPDCDVAFSDVRFPNEAAAIRDRGGEVWRITRPGTAAINAHPSETALDGFDFDRLISNAGSVAALRTKVLGHACL